MTAVCQAPGRGIARGSTRAPMALLRQQADSRLAALAAGGHQPAFDAIVERYRAPLLCYCRRMLPEGAAEDCVQQAFMKAWAWLSEGGEVANLPCWLYRIARNTALNALKRPDTTHEELHDTLIGSDGPEPELERRMAVRETLISLAELPEAQRTAMLAVAVHGESGPVVARELGITDTVQSLGRPGRPARALAPPGIQNVDGSKVRAWPQLGRVGSWVPSRSRRGVSAATPSRRSHLPMSTRCTLARHRSGRLRRDMAMPITRNAVSLPPLVPPSRRLDCDKLSRAGASLDSARPADKAPGGDRTA